MPTTNFTKVINYIADTSGVVKELSKLQLINSRIASGLGKDFSQATQTMGEAVTGLTKSNLGDFMSKVSTNVTLADGRMGKFTETTKLMADGSEKVTTSFQEMDKSSQSLGENIGRLLSRAALTIPIWLALRGAVMGTISAFKNGLAGIIDYDKALQKLKKSLQGTPEEIARNFNSAKDTITKFSIETGKSTEDITRAIQRFATVGFDFETSMKAGLDATRLSILLFGEAEETANAFSRAMRVLVTDVKNTSKSQDEIARAMALTSELYETNAFELKELNGGLEKFAGTAKSMGFTLEETITLLAALSTRGLSADRAGTLLRTTTQKLEQNLSKVAKVLGIQVNPAVDRTFDVFMKVTNAIAQLKNEAGTISPAVSDAIGDLFGGVRGGEPIRDLIADMGNVNEAFNTFLSVRPDIRKFRQEVENMNEELFRQVEIYHNLNKEFGKAFLTGITGATDFDNAIKKINASTQIAVSLGERWGASTLQFFQLLSLQSKEAIKTWANYVVSRNASIGSKFQDLGKIAARGFESGLTSIQFDEVAKIMAELRTDLIGKDKGIVDERFLQDLDEMENIFIQLLTSSTRMKNITTDINSIEDEIVGIKKEQVINESQIVDYEQAEAFLKEKLKLLGKDDLEIAQKILDLKNENKFATYEELETQKRLIENLKEMQKIELERTKTRGLINNQVEELKLRGATNLQLLQAESILKHINNLDQDKLSLVNQEIALQRAITAEKLNQNKLSSDSLKIFEISQKFGIGTAFDVSRFIKGEIPVQALESGGKFSNLADIIKEYFPALIQQMQASSFFFEGLGTELPIAERTAMEQFNPQRFENIKFPEIKTEVGDIKIEIKQTLEKEQLSKYIVDELKDYLDENLSSKIEETIERY